jgi:hypothetical protein
MTKKISTTPTATVARALRNLGLVQGHDFRVRGVYVNGERTRTVATIFGVDACAIVRFYYGEVENECRAFGHNFQVRDYGLKDVVVQN